jgi:tetratricopeptide (TPR) repeat protein
MKKTQWAVIITALIVTILLYLKTQDKVFGIHPKHSADDGHGHNATAELSADTLLFHAKENLTPEQRDRISFLENSISRGNVNSQKIHLFHQLAVFWRDTARIFEPFAWYTAEASRLENSEKSLTFAAHLFLNNLKAEDNPALKHWKGHQALDLFERSLKLNPANDSSAVGLGAVYLFGDVSPNPMEGIQKIRQVVEKDSTNTYAHMTLGHASVLSGQMDRAIERFTKVVKLQSNNLEAVLSLAEAHERQGNKAEALKWYKHSLSIANIPGLKEEVERRIEALSK